jgi:aryl-alcohol dehydrogenase-like predicted oxidoreductase
MRYLQLGKTELSVSQLILGSMQFGWTADEPTAFAIMDAFVEAGGTTIDTADIYTTWAEHTHGGIAEEIIGRWMRQRNNRSSLIIATKGRGRMWDGPDGEGLSRAHLTRAVDDSLRRLQIDHIDLYQTHWDDENVPLEETLGTLNDMIQAGKLRAIGCSNTTAAHLEKALTLGDQPGLARYNSLQPHYNMAHRREFEAHLQALCTEHNVGVLPYSPLGGGFLTGKYRRGDPIPESTRANSIQRRYYNERGWHIIDTLDEIARAQGRSISQIALAWLLHQPAVTAPIIGANKMEHLRDLLGALAITLSPEEQAALTSASEE